MVYILIAFGAYKNGITGWEAGNTDLGFWWTVIGVQLTIAGLGALFGTWIHTFHDEGHHSH